MLWRSIVVGLGLAIMYPALIYHGIVSVHPPPKIVSIGYPGPYSTPEDRKAHAEEQDRRERDYKAAQTEFSKILLIAATVLGVAAILLGSLISIPAISAGVMAGGAIAVGVGYFGYSSGLPEWWRFSSLVAGGLSLAWVGYRQWRDDWL